MTPKFNTFFSSLVKEMSAPFTSYVNPGAVLDDKWEEDKDISTDFDSFKTKYGDSVLVKSCVSDLNRFFFSFGKPGPGESTSLSKFKREDKSSSSFLITLTSQSRFSK